MLAFVIQVYSSTNLPVDGEPGKLMWGIECAILKKTNAVYVRFPICRYTVKPVLKNKKLSLRLCECFRPVSKGLLRGNADEITCNSYDIITELQDT